MVGHDHRDRQMAQRAGDYIHAANLRAGCLDRIVEPDEEYEPSAADVQPAGKDDDGVNLDGRADLAGREVEAKADMGRWARRRRRRGRREGESRLK